MTAADEKVAGRHGRVELKVADNEQQRPAETDEQRPSRTTHDNHASTLSSSSRRAPLDNHWPAHWTHKSHEEMNL